ncbi:MAG: 5-methylcytosine-specific restriction endonuclease system specificity protein McrC [Caldicoprobacterales bacterium]|jgi:5-methylcytosine-specific restriction endonuclease McrBC regulatory subunit McrC|nr:5-methylcytosine-specific restriction endonuclease system specificity protein McrC [Clostridiales bacterium]
MIKDKSIFIKNIYYMLTYAFQVLKQSNYEEIASEEFENIEDLFAAILLKGISQQLKQGLHKEYITKWENLSVLRGKLDINKTIQNKIQRKHILSCEYDDLSENNIYNQILKTTAYILLKEPEVNELRRAELKKVMLFFDSIDMIDPTSIQWNRISFHRNNRNYEMLLNICYFVLDDLLQTTEKGRYKMAEFSDERMSRLFERFVLEYYRYHHKHLEYAKAAQIDWNLDDDVDQSVIKFLPKMQTDITLKFQNKILIIDTKYYSKTLQTQYNSHTIHSNNLYQIFTYVKSKDKYRSGNVSGLLLYARTDESITPDCEFPIDGNRISVKTLDLNTDFKFISQQLNKIAESHFGMEYEILS